MANPVTRVVPPGVDPDVRIRLRWAENLQEAMRHRGVDKYELGRRLQEHGVKVTRQAIETWMSGAAAPRPHIQQAIGTALDIPARTIFLLENAPQVSA